MPTSRATTIRDLIATIVTTQVPTMNLSYDARAFDEISNDLFPHCMILTAEDEPETLAFKQERRRVVTTLMIGYKPSPTATHSANRETLQYDLELIRDAIFADPDLSSTVDGSSVGASAIAYGRDGSTVFGTLEITSDEVF